MWFKRWKELALLAAVVIACLLIAEIGLRMAFPDPYLQHPVYGWSRQPFYNETITVQDDINVTRYVNNSYGLHGFKRWGNTSSNKTKVLIIGDSFTEMVYVNQGEEWYSYLERAYPDTEFFVFGTGGYGTLQEYMVLRDRIGEIKPDVIIWQFYFNDFQNNFYESEIYAYPSTNKVKRPFLENGKIRFRLPVPFGWLRDKSRLVGLTLNLYDIWREKDLKDRDVFFSYLYGENFWDQDFANSKVFVGKFDAIFNITADIFLMAKQEAGDAPIYFFSADPRLEDYERQLADKANMIYIDGVYDALMERKQEKNVFVINDGHWNLEGNRVVGEFLVDYFANTTALK